MAKNSVKEVDMMKMFLDKDSFSKVAVPEWSDE
jgi:hypothetical protein